LPKFHCTNGSNEKTMRANFRDHVDKIVCVKGNDRALAADLVFFSGVSMVQKACAILFDIVQDM